MIHSLDTTLLMVIDMQIAIDDPCWGKRNNPGAEKNIEKLLELWRSNSEPVLHVKHMSLDSCSPYHPSKPGNAFKSGNQPEKDEWVLKKETNSAFINTSLEADLNKQGIKNIVITGVKTNNSVEATARHAGNLGFCTIVVADACFTFAQTGISGQHYDANLVHDVSLSNLQDEYAEIMLMDSVTSEFSLTKPV